MGVACRHCGSGEVRRNGHNRGTQRFLCRACGRTSTQRAPRHGEAVRAEAVRMHLNNVGVRKIALFLRCSPGSVVNWVRAAHAKLAALRPEPPSGAGPDVVEMDEIYTHVQKKPAGPWSGRPTRGPGDG